MQGQVYKIHSDFYYVKVSEQNETLASDFASERNKSERSETSIKTDGGEILECKLRENLKKQKIQVCVGDFVEIGEGAIEKLLPRKNFIKRPSVANLDLLVIVSSIKEPALDFVQLDRYLTFAKYHKIPAALCFNKEDLEHENTLENDILATYKPLGYDIIFTSAIAKTGLEGLVELAKGKVLALCGNSGVGKSTLLNAIGASNLRTKNVSQKTERGVHTTRHVEILDLCVNNYDFKIMDTPGFSLLRFDFLMPQELTELFPDIAEFAKWCKFSDCNHIDTKDCAVITNADKISKTRYKSFLELLGEAREYKRKVTYSGIKAETSVKDRNKKVVPKISNKKRALSRKVQKQNVADDLL